MSGVEKKMKRYGILFLAVVLWAASAVSAAAAEKLVVYTSLKESIIGSMKEAFVKKYPDISVDYQSAGAGKLMAKIATERQSGKIMADVIWTSEVPDFFNMRAEGILEKYVSPEMPNVINPFNDFDGSFTAVRLGTLGIAYNKRYVKQPPTQWSDMTKPEFKKAFGIANPALSGTAYMSVQLLVDKFGWDYVENVHKNGARIGKGSGQVVDDTASGDLLACIGVDYIVNEKIKKGADLALAYPPEMLVIPSPAAIFKGTPNLDAAKKFVDFLLSEEGQKILAEQGTLPVRKGIAPGKEYGLPSGEEAMARSLKIDYQKILDDKEATIKKFTDIMMAK
jgi:iron(III) transport system substrate-binding protein